MPALCIGFILGLLLVILEISFAAMIFSGEMSHLATRGAGLTLAGAFLVCAASAFISSFKSIISLPQDAPVAIFSGAAALMATGMGLNNEGLFITVVAALILSSFLTAVFLFIIARFSLVHFFRYIPYPVIGGFLAGSGWIMFTGSLEVMSGGSFSLKNPGFLFAPEILSLWLPGTMLAIGLFIVLRRYSHFSILPAALILGVLLFHMVLHLGGISLDQAREMGLLFETFASTRLWPVFTWSEFSEVRWSVVLSQMPVLMTIPLISLIGLLLNMSGIELASRKEIDMNHEIMGNSLINVLAGTAGSPPAYNSLSLSMLGFKSGAFSRIVGLAAALVVAITLIWGATLISIFPKAVLGGFLMLLGLFFLWDWVIETRTKMAWPDFCIILAILATIAWLGFFQGVMLGILLAVVLFVIKFSQVPIIDMQCTGLDLQSNRARPLPHKKILIEQGDRIRVFELSGYLFFGSVNSLVQKIQEDIENAPASGANYLIIDFSRTSGIDISSVSAFVRLLNKLTGKGYAKIIFTAPDAYFLQQVMQHLGQEDEQSFLMNLPDLNQGLRWAEDKILDEQTRLFADREHRHDQIRLFNEVADDMLKNLEELEYAEDILKRIENYAQELKIEKGASLLEPGQNIRGFYWLNQGKISRHLHGDSREAAESEYGPGDFLNINALFEERTVHSLYQAESSCLVLFFSREKIAELENQNPEMAAKLYALLLKASTRICS